MLVCPNNKKPSAAAAAGEEEKPKKRRPRKAGGKSQDVTPPVEAKPAPKCDYSRPAPAPEAVHLHDHDLVAPAQGVPLRFRIP